MAPKNWTHDFSFNDITEIEREPNSIKPVKTSKPTQNTFQENLFDDDITALEKLDSPSLFRKMKQMILSSR